MDLKAELENLRFEIDHKQDDIERIDEILKELFGVTFEICKTDEGSEILKNYLKKKIETITLYSLLSTSAIKIADKIIDFGLEYHFTISDFQQIVQHLVVYCNRNMEDKENAT